MDRQRVVYGFDRAPGRGERVGVACAEAVQLDPRSHRGKPLDIAQDRVGDQAFTSQPGSYATDQSFIASALVGFPVFGSRESVASVR